MRNYINHNVTTSTFVRFFLVLLAFVTIWFLQDLFISLIVSVFIASAISPLATKLQKIYIPRSVSVLTVLLLITTLLFGIIVLFVPIVTDELNELSKQFPKIQTEFLQNVETYTGADLNIKTITKNTQIKDFTSLFSNVISKTSGSLKNAASAVTGFIFQIIIILVFTFYLTINEKGVESFLRLITPKEKEEYVVDLWNRSQNKIVAWAKGQFILAFIIGLIVYIGLLIIGLPNALLFALLAFVGEFIPMIGMTIATIPAILIAFMTYGSSFTIIVAIFYFIVSQTENHILAPYVVNKIVGVPALIVVISLLAGAILIGFWGVLLAVPISAIIMEYINDFGSKRKLNIENIS